MSRTNRNLKKRLDPIRYYTELSAEKTGKTNEETEEIIKNIKEDISLNTTYVEAVNPNDDIFIPKPLLKLDISKYKTIEERLKFFIDNGRYFTNSNITESRDHAINEFVYPVFRTSNEMAVYNPLRIIYETYYNNRYKDYFPLNKYAYRLAAFLPSDHVNTGNPDTWYYYAWYSVDHDPFTYIATLPIAEITLEQFNDGGFGNLAAFGRAWDAYIKSLSIVSSNVFEGVSNVVVKPFIKQVDKDIGESLDLPYLRIIIILSAMGLGVLLLSEVVTLADMLPNVSSLTGGKARRKLNKKK